MLAERLQLPLLLLLHQLPLFVLPLLLLDHLAPVEPGSKELATAAEAGPVLEHLPQGLPACERFAISGDPHRLFLARKELLNPCCVVLVGELAAPADFAELALEALVKYVWLVSELLVDWIVHVLTLDVGLQHACSLQAQGHEAVIAQSVVIVPDQLSYPIAQCFVPLQLLLVVCHQPLNPLPRFFRELLVLERFCVLERFHVNIDSLIKIIII